MLKIARVLLLLPVIVCAQTVIPEEIQVPTDNFSVLTLHAKGEQIYQCISNKGQYSWQWLAPKAQLFDAKGQLAGSHAAGPEWTHQDGSRVTGRLIKKIDVASDSTVAWLLLEAVEHHGDGVFANTRFIHRINTRGGLPPVSGCDANHLGTEKSSGYSADYLFYAR